MIELSVGLGLHIFGRLVILPLLWTRPVPEPAHDQLRAGPMHVRAGDLITRYIDPHMLSNIGRGISTSRQPTFFFQLLAQSSFRQLPLNESGLLPASLTVRTALCPAPSSSMISSTFTPSLSRRDTNKSNVGHEGVGGSVHPPLTSGGGSFGPQSAGAIYQHIHDMAAKRISTLDYLRKAWVQAKSSPCSSIQTLMKLQP